MRRVCQHSTSPPTFKLQLSGLRNASNQTTNRAWGRMDPQTMVEVVRAHSARLSLSPSSASLARSTTSLLPLVMSAAARLAAATVYSRAITRAINVVQKKDWDAAEDLARTARFVDELQLEAVSPFCFS